MLFTKGIIGIDPGVSGGIVVWRSPGEYVVYPMPTTACKILKIFERAQPSVIYVEKLTGFVAGSITPSHQVFKMGINYGKILAACELTTADLIEVHPIIWQKDVAPGAIDYKRADKKKYLNALAKKIYQEETYPAVKGITLKTCDAALILRYGMKQQKELI